jgi:type I restriction enzyme M protein
MDQSKSLKQLRNDYKEHGVFYTDSKLAEIIKQFIPSDVKEVYDPTCGSGALLSAFGDDVVKYGQELNTMQAEETQRNLKNAHIAAGDTLLEPAFLDKKFRGIVANPPFSVSWEPGKIASHDARFIAAPCLPPRSKADYAFLLHILYMLSEDGVAACLGFPGILYRGQREGKIREWLVRINVIEEIHHIPGGFFDDTNIATCLIVMKKNRGNRNTIRFVDMEHGISGDILISDIEANGFNLSVSSYVTHPEPEKPPFDSRAVELQAHEDIIARLKKEIDFSKRVALIEGWDLDKVLISRLKDLINSY